MELRLIIMSLITINALGMNQDKAWDKELHEKCKVLAIEVLKKTVEHLKYQYQFPYDCQVIARYQQTFADVALAACKKRDIMHDPQQIVGDMSSFPNQDEYEHIVHGEVKRNVFMRKLSNRSYAVEWTNYMHEMNERFAERANKKRVSDEKNSL